ncbi:Env protein [Simian immunodeficiency virus - olc]|uniref:Envelope glycoprotein gp160 n=1 Tax=Simian immunodeficiency virus - olc TaxID=538563 RepID=B7UES4_SIV|nr:Env protein [Simian immunodeficiency virus - olc]
MRKKLVLCLLWLSILGISIGQYVTVFYGTPKWRDSNDTLMCVTANKSLWVTTACLPSFDEDEIEQPIPGVEEVFYNVSDNEVVRQAWFGIASLLDAVLKPCVKLTPFCVKMQCEDPSANFTEPITPISTAAPTTVTSSTGGQTTTIGLGVDNSTVKPETEKLKQCRYNITGLCRDCKIEMNQTFDLEDVACTNNTCYMSHCNTSVITQDCQYAVSDQQMVKLCAPPGRVLIKCNNRTENPCRNISAVTCTPPLSATVSSFFGFNGTRHKASRLIPITGDLNHKPREGTGVYVMAIADKYKLEIECIRKGNRSIVSVNSASGLVYYAGLEPYGNIDKGLCRFKGQWGWMLYALGKGLEKENNTWANYTGVNITGIGRNSTTFAKAIKRFKFDEKLKRGGDDAAENMMMMCGGYMWFCNITKILKTWNNASDPKWYPWSQCRLRQNVDDWMKVGRRIYLPPQPGFNNRIRCTQRVTEMFLEIQKVENGTQVSLLPPSDNVNQFVSVASDYKLVELELIGFAPTETQRYQPRNKRGALVLGLLGVLGLAGSAMGTVSTILTVQSSHLLAGIVRQQKHMLEMIEKQQELLKLTIWGVKNLQARLLGVEKYLKDQALLKQWGCEFMQVCHTTVPWNYTQSPDWGNDTWLKWQRKVDNLTQEIDDRLTIAYQEQQRNQYELQRFQELSDWTKWFNLANWMTYVKIGLLVVLAYVGLNIVLGLVRKIRIMRQGYVSLQLPFSDTLQDKEQPDNGEGEDSEFFESTFNEWNCTTECTGTLRVNWRDLLSHLWKGVVRVTRWIQKSLQHVWRTLKQKRQHGINLQQKKQRRGSPLQKAQEQLGREGAETTGV